MILNDEVELVEGEPIAYIRPLKALVMADLHLGYEAAMAKRGMLLPHANLKSILSSIENASSVREVTTLIVNGDIKNDFSTVGQAESNELYDFCSRANALGMGLVLIKGNHDNFIERYREAFRFEVHRQEARIGDFLFFHGEEMPGSLGKLMVMGHEHPAIGIYDAAGRLEKLKCFLYGRYKGGNLLVLPAMNYFSSGTAVNIEPKGSLLSPLLRNAGVESMEAIALGYGSTLAFGKVRELRRIAAARHAGRRG